MSFIQWHIGCSGFHYKEWKGIFYPGGMGPSKWFEYYCRHFNTLELNTTFYRFPQAATLRGWRGRSPGSFRFSVKAPRLVTHYKKFDGTESLLADFYGTIAEGLGPKLGIVLFQLPPQLAYSAALLQRILESLDTSFANTVEFRHESWWRPDVYDRLAAQGISFCGISHPRLPDTVIANTQQVYYRFHGVPDLYRSAYADSSLEAMAAPLLHHKTVQSAWIYFNNTAGPAALANARWLCQRVGLDSPVPGMEFRERE